MGKKYPISYTKLLSSGEKCEKLWSRSKSSSKFGLGGHSEVMIQSFISVAESLHHKFFFFSSKRYHQRSSSQGEGLQLSKRVQKYLN